jgi:hypothetical protein
MATSIKQRPKVTKKSNAKAKKVGGGKGGVKHVHGLSQQKEKTAKGKGGHGTVELPKGVHIVEYPGEGKGKGFGPGVKVVGKGG